LRSISRVPNWNTNANFYIINKETQSATSESNQCNLNVEDYDNTLSRSDSNINSRELEVQASLLNADSMQPQEMEGLAKSSSSPTLAHSQSESTPEHRSSFSFRKPAFTQSLTKNNPLRKLLKRSKSEQSDEGGDEPIHAADMEDAMEDNGSDVTTLGAETDGIKKSFMDTRNNVSLRRRKGQGLDDSNLSLCSEENESLTDSLGDSLDNIKKQEDTQCSIQTTTFSKIRSTSLVVFGYLWTILLTIYGKLCGGINYIFDNKVAADTGVEEDDHSKPSSTALNSRIYHICNELMTSEESYVERLGILAQAHQKATKVLGADIANDMFRDIHNIHEFHRDDMLPQLQERIQTWSCGEQRVGDIMKRVAPYFKLYTDYVKDFQKAVTLVDRYEEKSSTFAAALKSVQENQGPPHGKLKIQAHMMEPIQRVPRYKLLLQDYIKRISPNSSDRADTQKALELVAEAAVHFEDMMKRDTRMSELMNIQSRLDGTDINLVSSKRELLKEGRLQRVKSGAQGEHAKVSQKYAFLFNDMLLICTKQKFVIGSIIMGKYRVQLAVQLSEIESIHEGHNLEFPFTFYLKCIEEDLELCGFASDESLEWFEVLKKTLDTSRNMESSDSGLLNLVNMARDQTSHAKQGLIQLSDDDGRTWKKRWFILHNGGILFAYRKQQDAQMCGSLNCRNFNKSIVSHPRKGQVLELQWQVLNEVKYLLYDDSEEELSGWHNSIVECDRQSCH